LTSRVDGRRVPLQSIWKHDRVRLSGLQVGSNGIITDSASPDARCPLVNGETANAGKCSGFV
jgi:hypothetical protein